MKDTVRNAAGAALVGFTLAATAVTQAFAQQGAPVEPVIEPGEIFDVCAAEALDRTPEARPQNNMSAFSMGEDFADQNGTRLQLDGKGGVTASGPGAETAMREFIQCFTDPNLRL